MKKSLKYLVVAFLVLTLGQNSYSQNQSHISFKISIPFSKHFRSFDLRSGNTTADTFYTDLFLKTKEGTPSWNSDTLNFSFDGLSNSQGQVFEYLHFTVDKEKREIDNLEMSFDWDNLGHFVQERIWYKLQCKTIVYS